MAQTVSYNLLIAESRLLIGPVYVVYADPSGRAV